MGDFAYLPECVGNPANLILEMLYVCDGVPLHANGDMEDEPGLIRQEECFGIRACGVINRVYLSIHAASVELPTGGQNLGCAAIPANRIRRPISFGVRLR